MDEKIKAQLEIEEPTEFHAALLKHVKGLVEMSRRKMSEFYADWDHNDTVYRGRTNPDKQDAQAKDRGEPTKMIIPLTYSQINTFVAFCVSLYTQRERLFELVGTGDEDDKAAKIGEALLARDLTVNCIESILNQFLLDVARFGVGIIKTGWVRETKMEEVEMPVEGVKVFGMKITPDTTTFEETEVVTYLGNKLYNISPYRFFPDVRLPIRRFQDGEFVASEEEFTYVQLQLMQQRGDIAGLKWVKPFTKRDMDARSGSSRLTGVLPESDNPRTATETPQTWGTGVLTEVQVSLIPSKFMIDGKPMGDEDYPVKWNVWYLNDKRIVKAEPLGYAHNQYTYDVGEYSPDNHKLLNDGLAGTIDQLQSVITWLINSHITSVRKTIQNWLIVDPSGIEMKDLTDRKPVIRLRPDVARTGVDKWAKQLEVRDATANHIRDANELQGVVQLVTGINDNALGQFYTGRRSATEARNVNSAAAARLKLPALLLFRTALEPMARKMLSNHQQGLDVKQYVSVVGDNASPEGYTRFVAATRQDLIGNYDFEVFDGTLPSERGAQAMALEEFLVQMMKSPEVVMMLGYDPKKIVEEWLELRGIRNPKRFLLDQVRAQEMAQQIAVVPQLRAMLDGSGGQPGVPGAGGGGETAPFAGAA
jgi:hypothetical protein